MFNSHSKFNYLIYLFSDKAKKTEVAMLMKDLQTQTNYIHCKEENWSKIKSGSEVDIIKAGNK